MSQCYYCRHLTFSFLTWKKTRPVNIILITLVIELVSDKVPGAPDNKEYDPSVGEICLAFHRGESSSWASVRPRFGFVFILADLSVHNEWYRVEVKELAGNIAKVRLIDYEEDLSVPFTHLHQLPAQMKRFPPLAFKCSLQGVFHFTLLFCALIRCN